MTKITQSLIRLVDDDESVLKAQSLFFRNGRLQGQVIQFGVILFRKR